MVYSITAVAIILTISLSIASAIVDNSTVRHYVDIHNSMIDNAPQFVKNLAGNETVDCNITRNDGNIYRTGLEMKNAHVIKINEGGIVNPTVSINITEDAVTNILQSDDPLAAFMHEMNSRSVSIQMHHPHNSYRGGYFPGLPGLPPFFGCFWIASEVASPFERIHLPCRL